MSRCFRSVFCLLVLVSLFAGPAVHAADKPIAMSEVASLVKAGVSTDAVVEVMAKRGVRFRMSSTAERQLKKFGFNDAQLALIERIAKGEKVDPQAEAQKKAEDAEAGAEAQAEQAGDYPIGYPNPAWWHPAEQKRIERAIENAGLGYKRHAFTRFTLYCDDRRAAQLVPMLKKLEQQLIDTFPASIHNASSEQSAHIVIVDGVSEWNNWLDALEASYKQDGMSFSAGKGGDSFFDQVKDGPGFILPTVSVCNANVRFEDESVGRYAAYSAGYLMMQQAGGKKDKQDPDSQEEPDGLRTGFGNLAETMAFGSPSVLVTSYEKRDVSGNNPWKSEVLQRFEQRKIDNVTSVWSHETATMKFGDYAECWSYVSTLAVAPEKFAEAVKRVREDKTPMPVAVRETYGIPDKKLLETWYRWLGQ